jgi:hypothetical protein
MSRPTKHPPLQAPTSSYDKSIQFSQAQAIVWQIKFVADQINSKKSMQTAAAELESVSTAQPIIPSYSFLSSTGKTSISI